MSITDFIDKLLKEGCWGDIRIGKKEYDVKKGGKKGRSRFVLCLTFFIIIISLFAAQIYLEKKNRVITKLPAGSDVAMLVFRGDIGRMKIISQTFEYVEIKDNDGWTLLHYAAMSDNMEMYRILVDWGASESAKTEKEFLFYPAGVTPREILTIRKDPDERIQEVPISDYYRSLFEEISKN